MGAHDSYYREYLLPLAAHGDGHVLTVSIALLLAILTGRSDLCTEEDHFFESKKPMCLRPRNEIAAVTFFAKNCAALTKSNTLASVTEWQDPGEHGC